MPASVTLAQVLQVNLELPARGGSAGADVSAAAAALERFVELRPLLAGEALFVQGDPAEDFMILQSGQGEDCAGAVRRVW